MRDLTTLGARLIINADDFGLTGGVNCAIEELHRAGVLTSATLMANGAAFEHAVAIAAENPGLGVGCHVVLTDGTPVSPPNKIPTLLGLDRRSFRPTLREFVQALLLRQIDEQEIALESLAQVEKIRSAGIRITHLDSHKHTHLFPRVTRPLLQIAQRTGIRAMRDPFEPSWSRKLAHGSLQRKFAINAVGLLRTRFETQRQIADCTVLTTDGTLAISATGHLDSNTLAELLNSFPSAGTYELCCHPGYNDTDLDRITTRLRQHREIERIALLAEIGRLGGRPNGPKLIHYGDLR